MRETIAHRRTLRLFAAALLLAFAGALGGCGSLNAPSWDPSDLLDFQPSSITPGELNLQAGATSRHYNKSHHY